MNDMEEKEIENFSNIVRKEVMEVVNVREGSG